VRRYGALLRFKSGISKRRIEKALDEILPLLDTPGVTSPPLCGACEEKLQGRCRRVKFLECGKCSYCGQPVLVRPIEGRDLVHEYDDRHGCPVWYIP